MLKLTILFVVMAYSGVFYVYGHPHISSTQMNYLKNAPLPALRPDFRASNLTASVQFVQPTTLPCIENTTKSQANNANQYIASLFLCFGCLLSSAAFF